MTYQKEINISTKGFCDVIDITHRVNDIVSESKIKQGIVVIYITSSTSAITTIEHEKNLIKDFEELMEKFAPKDKNYRHGATWGDDNGFSHLRASLVGPSLAVPIRDGAMTLGAWQQIVLCDFDNRSRDRTIIVNIVGE